MEFMCHIICSNQKSHCIFSFFRVVKNFHYCIHFFSWKYIKIEQIESNSILFFFLLIFFIFKKKTTICARDLLCIHFSNNNNIDSIEWMDKIVPRAEIHTVCRIFHMAKKVNRNHVHFVPVNTVIFHRCVMVTLHFQHLKEDQAHTTLSIASNCKYKHQMQLIHLNMFNLLFFSSLLLLLYQLQ